MMDDYYAGPLTALVTCDRERRVLVAGANASAITGWAEGDIIGQEIAGVEGGGKYQQVNDGLLSYLIFLFVKY